MNTKLGFRIGEIEFNGEGDQTWVTQQSEKFLAKIPELLAIAPKSLVASPKGTSTSGPHSGNADVGSKTLATFLKERNATINQNRKFLATAVWLHAKNQSRLETGQIARALRDSHQSKINNPSDTLNQNVKKGFIEKDGKGFFVTEEGRTEILG